MALPLGASGWKKRRAGEEAKEDEAAAVAEEEDRISVLPEDLRLRILALLPLKPAIRTGALSTRWRALWARRWPAPSSLDLHYHSGEDPERLLESLERRGRRRLDRLSLTFHLRKNSPKPPRYFDVKDFHLYLDYAAACDVEDLHIDVADHIVRIFSTFSLPPGPGRSRLARLFLRRVSFGFPRRGDAFSALEVVHLHSVRFVDLDNLLLACPCLRTLDLRFCDRVRGAISVMPAGAHLRSLTVAECNNVTHIDADRASSLRSFRLSSALLPTYDISGTASLDDLYICVRGRNSHPVKQWIKALPNLSNLTVLTICSIALRRVYALARFGSATCLTELRNLPSLRDLQLLMFSMDSTNLAHIYMFFRCCRCPLLEKLFVQLPTSSHDIFMDNFMLVAEEDEPDEELSEEDKPYAELSEEDEPDAELSEEYETEEEVLEEGVSEEYILEERLEYEDVYEEDPSDENMPDEEQSEEGVPGYGLNNVIFAKMINFKGHFFEMRLVSFLLRKATGLKKLLLIAPKGNHMEALRKEPMDTSCFLEAELLRLKNASQNAQIVLSESDPAAIQPMHSDVFAKF